MRRKKEQQKGRWELVPGKVGNKPPVRENCLEANEKKQP
jgi:hypothetical protein